MVRPSPNTPGRTVTGPELAAQHDGYIDGSATQPDPGFFSGSLLIRASRAGPALNRSSADRGDSATRSLSSGRHETDEDNAFCTQRTATLKSGLIDCNRRPRRRSPEDDDVARLRWI